MATRTAVNFEIPARLYGALAIALVPVRGHERSARD